MAPPPSRSAELDRLVHLRSAKDLLDRAYGESLNLDRIAAAAGYSRFHFVRSFRAAYGETPGRYLSRRRVERAKDLLRTANLTVTEVCHLVGFTSLGSFSARFKELVGMSPVEYRERIVARSGPPPVPGCFILMRGAATSEGLRVRTQPGDTASGNAGEA